MENLEFLVNLIGEEKAKKIVKLTKNCEEYLNKFKQEMDGLVEELNCEVKVGLSFKSKED